MGANEKSAATWNGSSEAESGRQAMSNNHDLFPYDGHLERHADEQAEGNDKGAFPYVADLDDFEYTLTRRALRQIKAEVWTEAIYHLEPALGLLMKRAAHADNPYRSA